MKSWGKFSINTVASRENATVTITPGDDGTVWLSKREIAQAYGVFYAAVSSNLRVLFKSGELDVQKNMRIVSHTNNDGKRCQNELFDLATIIALGFRMKGEKCRLFRRWVVKRLSSPNAPNRSAYIFHLCDNMTTN